MIRITELINLNVPFILASESPRRRRLLKQLGFEFEVVPANLQENNSKGLLPVELAEHLACRKAKTVAEKRTEPGIVLGADTIVVYDGRILDKPVDKEDAVRILKFLSDNSAEIDALICELPGYIGSRVKKD